jgi:hypothetical protein
VAIPLHNSRLVFEQRTQRRRVEERNKKGDDRKQLFQFRFAFQNAKHKTRRRSQQQIRVPSANQIPGIAQVTAPISQKDPYQTTKQSRRSSIIINPATSLTGPLSPWSRLSPYPYPLATARTTTAVPIIVLFYFLFCDKITRKKTSAQETCTPSADHHRFPATAPRSHIRPQSGSFSAVTKDPKTHALTDQQPQPNTTISPSHVKLSSFAGAE